MYRCGLCCKQENASRRWDCYLPQPGPQITGPNSFSRRSKVACENVGRSNRCYSKIYNPAKRRLLIFTPARGPPKCACLYNSLLLRCSWFNCIKSFKFFSSYKDFEHGILSFYLLLKTQALVCLCQTFAVRCKGWHKTRDLICVGNSIYN